MKSFILVMLIMLSYLIINPAHFADLMVIALSIVMLLIITNLVYSIGRFILFIKNNMMQPVIDEDTDVIIKDDQDYF